jgi:hypothetical protein
MKLNLVKFNPEIGSYGNMARSSEYYFFFYRDSWVNPALGPYSRAVNQPTYMITSNVTCTITSWFRVQHWVPTKFWRNIQLYIPPVLVLWLFRTFQIGIFTTGVTDSVFLALHHSRGKTLMEIPDCTWGHCPWLRRNDLDVRNGLLSGLDTISWLHTKKYAPHYFQHNFTRSSECGQPNDYCWWPVKMNVCISIAICYVIQAMAKSVSRDFTWNKSFT